jgi:hypothetical protein
MGTFLKVWEKVFAARRSHRGTRRVRPRRGARPALEALESRYAPAELFGWDPLGADHDWEVANNWVDNGIRGVGVPGHYGTEDIAIFNTNTADCNLSEDTTIFALSLFTGYTGTLTLHANNLGGDIVFNTVDRQPLRTSGTGVIQNYGVVERLTGDDNPSISELPLINYGSSHLVVLSGTLAFTKAGNQNGVSVLQISGTTEIDAGATLRADYGYVQQNGSLETRGYQTLVLTATIDTSQGGGNADVKIHGGVVQVGVDGTYGILKVTTSVTMDGGTYKVEVDGTTLQHDEFDTDAFGGFTIGPAARLQVTTNNIPGGGVPAGTTVHLIQSGAIYGEFFRPNIVFLPGGIWDTEVSEDGDSYDLYT